jgi:hypothetical protein
VVLAARVVLVKVVLAVNLLVVVVVVLLVVNLGDVRRKQRDVDCCRHRRLVLL